MDKSEQMVNNAVSTEQESIHTMNTIEKDRTEWRVVVRTSEPVLDWGSVEGKKPLITEGISYGVVRLFH